MSTRSSNAPIPGTLRAARTCQCPPQMPLTATGALRPAFSGARPGVLSPRLSDGGVRRVRCACLPNPTALGLELHERLRPGRAMSFRHADPSIGARSRDVPALERGLPRLTAQPVSGGANGVPLDTAPCAPLDTPGPQAVKRQCRRRSWCGGPRRCVRRRGCGGGGSRGGCRRVGCRGRGGPGGGGRRRRGAGRRTFGSRGWSTGRRTPIGRWRRKSAVADVAGEDARLRPEARVRGDVPA